MQLTRYVDPFTLKRILQSIIIIWYSWFYDTLQACDINSILPLLHAAKIIIFL